MPAATKRRSSRAARMPDKVMQYVLSSPWAISLEGLQKVLAIASRFELNPQALEQVSGEYLDNTRAVSVRNGVATIPVDGVLMKRAPWFAAISGAVDYESLARDVRTAIDDPNVKALLLAIDSPGGEVSGCSELAQQLMAAREQKPVVAYIAGDGCSAAYWLASACSEIHVADTAIGGCLGVRMTFIDDSRFLKREGFQRIEIVSSQTPDKAMDPRTSEGKERVLAVINPLAAVFLQAVADGRDVDLDTVLNDFGKGDVFVGAELVERGMADSVTTYEALHAVLADSDERRSPLEEIGMAKTTKGRVAAKRPNTKAKAVKPAAGAKPGKTAAEEQDDDEDDEQEEPKGAASDDTVDDEDEDEDASTDASDDSDEEDDEDPSSKERKAGADAERARITGILALSKRVPLAELMPFVNDANCTKEKAAATLFERGTDGNTRRLRALRNDDAGVDAANIAPKASAPDNKTDAGKVSARMLRNFARVNPGAVPEPFRTSGSQSK